MNYRRCCRCGAEAIWQVSTVGQGGRNSCLTCLGPVAAECAQLWHVVELKVTAVDAMGVLV